MAGRGYRGSSSPFLASRVDENQSDIVASFRKLGYSVECLHANGNGVFDLLVSKHLVTFCVEVKDGNKPFSSRQFTPKQRIFNFTWQGQKCVAKCHEDVLSIHDQITGIIKKIKDAGIDMSLTGCRDIIYNPSLY